MTIPIPQIDDLGGPTWCIEWQRQRQTIKRKENKAGQGSPMRVLRFCVFAAGRQQGRSSAPSRRNVSVAQFLSISRASYQNKHSLSRPLRCPTARGEPDKMKTGATLAAAGWMETTTPSPSHGEQTRKSKSTDIGCALKRGPTSCDPAAQKTLVLSIPNRSGQRPLVRSLWLCLAPSGVGVHGGEGGNDCDALARARRLGYGSRRW